MPTNTTVDEIAPDVFRIATYVPQVKLPFCQFLVRDHEPLLFHTGGRAMFAEVRDAVARVLDPASIRWIGFSHFEADECGSLNEWLATAPAAEAVCSKLGAMVSVNDFASRPARGMVEDEVLTTGARRFRFRQTPHVPHCWEAGLLFEETTRTLLCSDLFLQYGDVEPLTHSSVVERAEETLVGLQAGPFAHVMPYTTETGRILHGLADLEPTTLAVMHGSTFIGDGGRALRDLNLVMRRVLGSPGSGS
ncbi:MAG: MBL fold metallo-hydrolase [Chloroflexota bacterium]